MDHKQQEQLLRHIKFFFIFLFKICSCILLVIITLSTFDSDLCQMVFIGGSYTSVYFAPNPYLLTVFLVLIIFLIFYRKITTSLKISLLLIFTSIWFILGRAISVEYNPDLGLRTGWFFFGNKVYPIPEKENTISLKNKSFFFLTIMINDKESETFFTGLINNNELRKILEN